VDDRERLTRKLEKFLGTGVITNLLEETA